jgi:hypothetical protein
LHHPLASAQIVQPGKNRSNKAKRGVPEAWLRLGRSTQTAWQLCCHDPQGGRATVIPGRERSKRTRNPEPSVNV